MPGNNNPWAGELPSRRKMTSVGRQTSEGKSPKHASPGPQQLEGKDLREALTSHQPPTEKTLGRSSPGSPLISCGQPKSPLIPLDKAVPTNCKPTVPSAETEESFTPSNPSCTPKQNNGKVKQLGDNEAKGQVAQGSRAAQSGQRKKSVKALALLTMSAIALALPTLMAQETNHQDLPSEKRKKLHPSVRLKMEMSSSAAHVSQQMLTCP